MGGELRFMIKYVAGLLSGILIITSFSATELAVGKTLPAVKPGSKSATVVGKIAKDISVYIETIDAKNTGSGMILHKQSDLYTVLTAAHVVRKGKGFQFTTADGQVHQSIDNSVREATNNLDLATVQFRSNKSYAVAKLGSSQSLSAGMDIYVAGFPAQTTAIRSGILNYRQYQSSQWSRLFINL
jgi:S1-C subfamily serine protease